MEKIILKLETVNSDEALITLILAHGSGQSMNSEFMVSVAAELIKECSAIEVIRFNFPFMDKIESTGRHRPPDRPVVLEEYYKQVVDFVRSRKNATPTLLIGGKSLGGRIATMIADEMSVDGVVCLGYPFHPPGKPERLRTAHLQELVTPTLICQGERDPFGNHTEVLAYTLPKSIEICWLNDGEHSFKTRKSSGVTQQDNLSQSALNIAAFALQTMQNK